MGDDLRPWVMDTSAFTHLCRAGHASIIERLTPGGVLVVPTDVNTEIETGRARYTGIPSPSASPWVELAVLTEDEEWTQAQVKSQMGGGQDQHMGECAVIAVAVHRDMVAILDERAAIAQAELRKVATHDTLWIVIEALEELFDGDRDQAIAVVDDLIGTDMKLPISSGENLIVWAWENGYLPRED